jgi:uncharacterized protein YfdQ (DUF2303 family)
MSDDNKIPTGVKAALDFAAKVTAPVTVKLDHPERQSDTAILLREGNGDSSYLLASDILKPKPQAPERRKGKITVHDLASFITATNRDKRTDSVIFADVPAKRLVAVLDFHGPADSAPRFGEDRIEYGFKLSQQLSAWLQAANGLMDQRTFSRLIDDRLGDIGDPDAVVPGSLADDFAKRRGIMFPRISDLIVFTRTISTKSVTDSEERLDENTGDVSIQFKKKNDVKTADGQPVPVPAAFLLSIPVLNGIGATVFTFAVRLRFDIQEKTGIQWRIEINALDKYIEAAVKEALETVRKPAPDGCGLPVWLASIPE